MEESTSPERRRQHPDLVSAMACAPGSPQGTDDSDNNSQPPGFSPPEGSPPDSPPPTPAHPQTRRKRPLWLKSLLVAGSLSLVVAVTSGRLLRAFLGPQQRHPQVTYSGRVGGQRGRAQAQEPPSAPPPSDGAPATPSMSARRRDEAGRDGNEDHNTDNSSSRAVVLVHGRQDWLGWLARKMWTMSGVIEFGDGIRNYVFDLRKLLVGGPGQLRITMGGEEAPPVAGGDPEGDSADKGEGADAGENNGDEADEGGDGRGGPTVAPQGNSFRRDDGHDDDRGAGGERRQEGGTGRGGRDGGRDGGPRSPRADEDVIPAASFSVPGLPLTELELFVHRGDSRGLVGIAAADAGQEAPFWEKG
eukprot:jgi/Mesvir1/27827/Mv07505-RA.1